EETLQAVTEALTGAPDGLSAAAAADLTGVSRVTARRYLEYLAENLLAHRRPHYGQVGRPEMRFYPGSTGYSCDECETTSGNSCRARKAAQGRDDRARPGGARRAPASRAGRRGAQGGAEEELPWRRPQDARDVQWLTTYKGSPRPWSAVQGRLRTGLT